MPLIFNDDDKLGTLAYGSRSNYVAAEIRELIVSGILIPREHLRIDEVAEFFKVSATPVREALHLLHAEGLIDRSAGSGFRVHPLTGQDIEDIFLAHSFVAGELAARAVPNISADDLRELRAINHDTLALIERDQLNRLNEVNMGFHQLINRAAKSPRLKWLTSFYLKYMPQRRYGLISKWPEITANSQKNLIAALNDSDVGAARTAAENNVLNAGRALATHFSEKVHDSQQNVDDDAEAPASSTGGVNDTNSVR